MRDVNIKLRTIKPLKDNIGGNLSHPELGRVFLDMTPKIWSIKAVKWKVGLHHNSGLLLWKKKKSIKRQKRQAAGWEKHICKYLPNKILPTRIYKEL